MSRIFPRILVAQITVVVGRLVLVLSIVISGSAAVRELGWVGWLVVGRYIVTSRGSRSGKSAYVMRCDVPNVAM